ncbi:MAG: hypothetical protein WC284_10880 [Candidimonas sp.]
MTQEKSSKWHFKAIKKGTLGELSKIQEELDEAIDAHENNQKVMMLYELCDIIGATEAVAQKYYGLKLIDLIKFVEIKKHAMYGDN